MKNMEDLLLSMEMFKVKTAHDLIRESLEEKTQSPAPTTETGERAESQKLGENKKLSKEAMPSFQFREAESIPGVPRLSGMAVRVSGCANPNKAPFQNAQDDNLRREMGEIRRSRMSEENQAQFNISIRELRSETVKFIDCLIRYDDGIDMEDVPKLQETMLIIAGGKVIP